MTSPQRAPSYGRPLAMECILAGAVAAFLLCGAAHAQTYPTKPIRLIVPFPPGGGNDTVARSAGQELAKVLGQQVVIDNRPGAGGSIGAVMAANALPDGYTLFLAGLASHGTNPVVNAKLPYDPVKDFTPVSLLASAPYVVVVHPSLPVKTLKDLIALAKAKPNALNFASSGNGSGGHLSVEMFLFMTGTKMTHVPYKGIAPALNDLLSGQVQLIFSSALSIMPQVKAGKVRALATTGTRRPVALPDLPTVAEVGVTGYETASWYGIVAPAGTSAETVNRLSTELQKIVRQPAMQERFNAEASNPIGSTPQEFAAHIQRELSRWAKVVKTTGPIVPD